MIKVKAAVSQGEAYQVFISRENIGSHRRVMTANAPKWFLEVVRNNLKNHDFASMGCLIVANTGRTSYAYNGDWIVRGADGTMIVLTHETFCYLYEYAS